MEFSAASKAAVAEILKRYPTRQAALIPVLHVALREFKGLPEEVLEYVADLLEIPQASVYAAATFYSMFRRKHAGKHLLQMCRSVSCSLLGAEELIEHLKKKLGVEIGETTADKGFTLCTVECLGACDCAPAMLADDRLHDHLTVSKVDEIIEGLSGATQDGSRVNS